MLRFILYTARSFARGALARWSAFERQQYGTLQYTIGCSLTVSHCRSGVCTLPITGGFVDCVITPASSAAVLYTVFDTLGVTSATLLLDLLRRVVLFAPHRASSTRCARLRSTDYEVLIPCHTDSSTQ